MTLKRWLKANNVTKSDFARKCGISKSSITKYLNGTRRPNIDQALAMQRETDELVTVDTWEGYTASDENPKSA